VKRPPSRSGSIKPKKAIKNNRDNVVQLFPNRTQPTKKIRANSKVTKFRPRISFGKRIKVSLIASVSVLVIFVLVAVFSPILAVQKIEIVGAHLVSKESIAKDLKSFVGKPLPQISSDEVASKLSKYELIDSVSVVSLPPSTLRVVVVERTAIATVVINNVRYLYDPDGVQIGRATAADNLPVIIGAGDPATSKSFSRAIDVLLSLPMSLLPKLDTIRASSKDNVVLGLRLNSQQILWGDASQPGLKAKVLAALMDHYPVKVGLTFDVSSPNQPSVY
jgi:cell division protein FtsQ